MIRADELLTDEQAQSAIAELVTRDDVVSAVPDRLVSAAAAPPVDPGDPLFEAQVHVWDSRSRSDGRIREVLGSSNRFPVGGYSAKAPAIWPATTGDPNVVVAVVDTGIRDDHPDLDDNVLPGFDFVDDLYVANDGDGRDSDASDPGDAQSVQEQIDWCGADPDDPDLELQPSSWHGTHVAGIVAAEAGNGEGVVGIAPSAKILPVRSIGRCGGFDSDVVDGIRWAAGLPVGGVPANPHPADVINLSLGGFDTYKCAPSYAEAIGAAQDAGVTVVAAAGNEDYPLDDLYFEDGSRAYVSPASCPGVVMVGATSEYGDRATYSNYGKAVDISAPGGDYAWEDEPLDDFGHGLPRAILSTVNLGVDGPGENSYAHYQGTSMATPVVAGAAALLHALGADPDDIQEILEESAARFPSRFARGVDNGPWICSTKRCGEGVVDLSRIPAPVDQVTISGTPRNGKKLTAHRGAWVASDHADGFDYRWYRDGVRISGADDRTYRLRSKDVGHVISVLVRPDEDDFRSITSVSEPTATVVR